MTPSAANHKKTVLARLGGASEPGVSGSASGNTLGAAGGGEGAFSASRVDSRSAKRSS